MITPVPVWFLSASGSGSSSGLCAWYSFICIVHCTIESTAPLHRQLCHEQASHYLDERVLWMGGN